MSAYLIKIICKDPAMLPGQQQTELNPIFSAQVIDAHLFNVLKPQLCIMYVHIFHPLEKLISSHPTFI